MAPFSSYAMAITMFVVGGIIAVSLMRTIDHFDGPDQERPKH